MLIADQREAPHTPLSNPLRKVFGPLSTMPITDQREAHDSFKCSRLPPRRFALLPFALLVELSAPVPVGVLHFNRGCHLGAELIRLPSLAHDRSAAPTQSPELGDSQQQKPCCQATFSSCAFLSGSYTSPVVHSRCSSIASFRATATIARFFALGPPLAASFNPHLFKSVSGPLRLKM